MHSLAPSLLGFGRSHAGRQHDADLRDGFVLDAEGRPERACGVRALKAQKDGFGHRFISIGGVAIPMVAARAGSVIGGCSPAFAAELAEVAA